MQQADRLQRLAQIMAGGSEEARFSEIGLIGLPLGGLQRFRCALALGDVIEEGQDGGLPLPGNRTDDRLEPDALAVLAQGLPARVRGPAANFRDKLAGREGPAPTGAYPSWEESASSGSGSSVTGNWCGRQRS